MNDKMKSRLFALATLFFLLMMVCCLVPSKYKAEREGSYALGNGLYMMDFDHGKVIVQGSYMEDEICYGGDYVIPLYEECYDSLGHVREYVTDAIADDEIIIVKTVVSNSNEYKYYLVDKKYDEQSVSNTQIRDSFTYIFSTLNELESFCIEKRIGTQPILVAAKICLLPLYSQRAGDGYNELSVYDTIFVSYQEGLYETSAATTCNQMKEWSVDEDVSEIVVIDKDSYDVICSYLSEESGNGEVREGCEARLYVQVSTYEMCVGDLGCGCDVNDNGIPTDKYALYLIRSLSGYYNYLDSLDLQYDNLINEFGFPSNYQKRIYPKLVVKGSPDESGACEIVEYELNEKGEYVEEYDYDDFRKVALVRGK